MQLEMNVKIAIEKVFRVFFNCVKTNKTKIVIHSEIANICWA